jgi:LacI family transcriptional regulator
MNRRKGVLLLIESSRAYGRGCLSGVAAYVRTHRNWQVLHTEWSLNEDLQAFVRDNPADGILSRIESPWLIDLAATRKCRIVYLLGTERVDDVVSLDTDPSECGRLAVDHFVSRGFRHMAFCGYAGVAFSDQRCQSFVQCLAERGLNVSIFEEPGATPSIEDIMTRERTSEVTSSHLVPWLQTLPKPVAVFACNDIRGRQVLASCANIGLSVPDDVAVLGVDNDEVICELSNPPLSSIEPDTRRLGYEGAATLDRLMAGEAAPEAATLIPPKRIHVRQSSDVLAVEDRDIAAALRYVREHACDGITVGHAAGHLATSRATLDRHFHRILGRSVKVEIDRIRIDRAKQLLEETDYKVTLIAEMTGYGMAPQFVTAFKRLTGMTPGEYRSRHLS